MPEVRIAPALLAIADEVDRPRLLVDAHDLVDVPFPGRDAVLEPPGREIVEVEVAPVVALRPPDHLVRRGQHAPVRRSAVARLRTASRLPRTDVANLAGRRIGDAQHCVLVIARGRDEREVRAVRIPLHIDPDLGPTTDHVVAERGAMRVRCGMSRAYDARRPSTSMMTRLKHRDDAVARQRILPRLERRVADLRVDEIHVAHPALVLLERRDLPRVGRPDENGPIAAHPAGVVRRVAEVLDAVGGELRLTSGGDVAHPEVERRG